MQHSKFSASSSHRWLYCPGSLEFGAIAEAGSPSRSTSPAAREGTGLHAVLDACLRQGVAPEEGATYKFDDHGEACEITLTAEQVEAVEAVIEKVNSIPGVLFLDMQVDYSETMGLPVGTAFGTLDVARLDGDHLHVGDAKFGRRFVDEVGNTQMLLYATGMTEALELLGDKIAYITLHIFQPRCGGDRGAGWTITRDDLTKWHKDLKRRGARVAEAAEAVREDVEIYGRVTGPTADQYLSPSVEGCQWCPAAGLCPSLEKVYKQTQNLADVGVTSMDDERITKVLEDWPLVEGFYNAVRKMAISRVTSGMDVTGYKMVLGRQGNRRWAEDEAVVVEKLALIGVTDVHAPPKLMSPAQMEKVHKVCKTAIENLTVRSPAKPTLVLESAPGEPWRPDDSVLDEFGAV